MTKALVIVESPAKAKTLEKFLGKNFQVRASGGHIRDLPASRMGVRFKEDFAPDYEIIKGKEKIIAALKKAANGCDEIYLAPDPDREGEAIAWHLVQALKLDIDKVKRIEFHEITKNAVLNAIKDPRKINMERVNAQQARRILDRLVGYKISPLLWKKIRKGLSAGRVQSVALRIICEREEEIGKFVPTEYWSIEADLLTKKNDKLNAALYKYNNKPVKIDNKTEADKILAELKKEKLVITDIETGSKKRNPSPPFITSTLQQDASRKLGWTAKKTMMVAQRLYEGVDIAGELLGLITYMRTDSTRISEEAKKAAEELILSKYGKEYLGKGVMQKAKKNVQDAHEAIRPTYVDKKPEDIKEFLNSDDYRLYDLIWKRFLASQMTPAEVDTKAVFIDAGKCELKATGNRMRFPGFMSLYIEGKDDHEAEESDYELPELAVKEELKVKEIQCLQHFTKPAPSFTEASLVKILEEKGIGRPSTYAPIISTIVERGYVEVQSKKLLPTGLGKIVNSQMVNHFSNIVDVDFTAKMESRLDEIIEGKVNWTDILRDFYEPFIKELALAEKNMPRVKEEAKPTDQVCDKCGSPMVQKTGKFGAFIACSAFPKCKNSKPLIVTVGVDCPECGGDIIEKRGRKGRFFYGCKNYPKCNFAVWNKPLAEKCKECGGLMVEFRKKAKCSKCGVIVEVEK